MDISQNVPPLQKLDHLVAFRGGGGLLLLLLHPRVLVAQLHASLRRFVVNRATSSLADVYPQPASLASPPLRSTASPTVAMLAFTCSSPWILSRHRFPSKCARSSRYARSARPRVRCCAEEPAVPANPDTVRALITSKTKAEQQKGLLLVRQLPPAIALELLLLCVETSQNEFIRSTAAIAIGQLDLSDPSTRSTAVEAMVNLLATDAEYSVRAAAGASMGYATTLPTPFKDTMLEALFRALLEDPEWQVQFSCLASLGSLRDPKAVPVLQKWLGAENDLLVQAAVGALGDIGQSEVVPDLLKLLGCDDMMTRQRLAQALGSIEGGGGEPSVIDALRTLSRDQSLAVREAAVESLKGFGCADAARAGKSDDEMIELEVQSLLEGDEGGNAGASASEALRRRLERSFDKEYVTGDLNGAREIEGFTAGNANKEGEATGLDMEGFEDIVNDLKHGNVLAQTMAAIKLRKFDGRKAVEAVTEAAALDPATASERLRSVCVGLLARGGEMERIIEILTKDPDQNVRSACCDALTDIGGGKQAVDACIRAFKGDSHWLVRVSAAIALGTIGKGSTEAEKELIASLGKEGVKGLDFPQDSVIRRHAVTALGFLGSKSALVAIEELLGREDCDSAIRLRVAGALRGIPCEESVRLIKSLVQDGNDEVAEMAQGTLDALAQRGFS